MDILLALQQSQAKEKPVTPQHDYMKKEVFECWLYRFGEDISDYIDVLPEDREIILNRFEMQK